MGMGEDRSEVLKEFFDEMSEREREALKVLREIVLMLMKDPDGKKALWRTFNHLQIDRERAKVLLGFD